MDQKDIDRVLDVHKESLSNMRPSGCYDPVLGNCLDIAGLRIPQGMFPTQYSTIMQAFNEILDELYVHKISLQKPQQ